VLRRLLILLLLCLPVMSLISLGALADGCQPGAGCTVAGGTLVRDAQAASHPVTGFGATTAAWNRSHVADHKFAPGAAYNPNLALPGGDAYVAVLHEDGHVLNYDYHFTPRSISAAKTLVLRTEFPRDARVVWFIDKGSCAQMLVRSTTLARAIGKKPIGDKHGTALIEFSSGVAEDTYNARSVNDALVGLGTLTPKSKAPAC
jgi:hypothetical protein